MHKETIYQKYIQKLTEEPGIFDKKGTYISKILNDFDRSNDHTYIFKNHVEVVPTDFVCTLYELNKEIEHRLFDLKDFRKMYINCLGHKYILERTKDYVICIKLNYPLRFCIDMYPVKDIEEDRNRINDILMNILYTSLDFIDTYLVTTEEVYTFYGKINMTCSYEVYKRHKQEIFDISKRLFALDFNTDINIYDSMFSIVL